MRGTPVVAALLAACGLVFVAELGVGDVLFGALALWPLGVTDAGPLGTAQFQPWQLVSYAFLHGGVLHLVLDMYALWLFGAPLERRWGSRRFAIFYFACVIGAGMTQLLVGELAFVQGGATYPVVGASGGVFGLLLAFGLLYPDVRLLLLIPPVPIKAKWFVIGYGLVELVAGITGTAAGIAHFAHLGGMLTGFLLLRGAGFRAL
jgi:membrane associated rhomboid family serine protease